MRGISKNKRVIIKENNNKPIHQFPGIQKKRFGIKKLPVF